MMKLRLTLLPLTLFLALASLPAHAASAEKTSVRAIAPLPPAPGKNSAHFIDVTRADGVLVKEPLTLSDRYDQAIAARNTERMKRIMESGAFGERCRIHFPAGDYYFDGAAPGWQASIQTSAKYQSITGDGINATRILQNNTEVTATLLIAHNNCTVQDLTIASKDFQQKYNKEWDDNPHQCAILFEAPNKAWSGTDPQVLNVNINATGNNVIVNGYHRPFKSGMKFLGGWLNVYVQSMFIQHVRDFI
jgi:hypothetical protein